MPVDLSVFKTAAPYRGFQEQDWNLLADRLREVRPSAGHMVFREKEPGDGFYFIRAGRVKISKRVVPEGKKAPHRLDAGVSCPRRATHDWQRVKATAPRIVE